MAVRLSLDLARLRCVQGISAADLSKQVTRAIILVPTRELAEQVSNHLKSLLKYCEGITSVNAAAGATTHLQRCVVISWGGVDGQGCALTSFHGVRDCSRFQIEFTEIN